MARIDLPLLAIYCTVSPTERVYDHTTKAVLPVSETGLEDLSATPNNCPRTDGFIAAEDLGCLACSHAANGYDPIVEGI